MEKEVEKYLVKKVELLGGKAYKFISPNNAGMPDRLVMFPNREICFVETKDKTKKPTKQQEHKHKILMGYGFRVWVLDSKEGVDGFLEFGGQFGF